MRAIRSNPNKIIEKSSNFIHPGKLFWNYFIKWEVWVKAVFLFILTLPTEAQAYIDPGSGSMLLQILLGGVAGLMMLIKLYWSKIKKFVKCRLLGGHGIEKEEEE